MYASNLSCAGLYTFPNDLSQVPVGALLQADECVIAREGVAETRRGIAAAGSTLGLSTGQYVDQFFPYQNRLIIHDTTGRMLYDTSGALTWSAYSGVYSAATGAQRIRGIQANKNFYFATSTGDYKLDTVSGLPALAGAPPGLDGTGSLAGAGAGFLAAAFQCAYQIVWGYTDANGNLILGNPSERILVINATGGADNVTLTFTVPQGLSTSYFYQIYRTVQTAYNAVPASNVPPGAELQLTTQQTVTAGQIAALQVVYTDVTTDALLGAFLYTNPSQQGALQTNDRPPLCADFCLFNQMVFAGYISSLQTTQFNLISVGAPNGIQLNDTIVVNGVSFTGKNAQNNASQQFKVDTSGTVAQNIDSTARNLVACINANAASTSVYAYYLSGYNDLPGIIGLSATTFAQGTFYVTSSRGGAFSPTLPSSGTSFASSNDSFPNGLAVSKVGQPEAFPLVNIEFIGSGDQAILRVLPLRDRVVILKTDGVYTVTGSTPQTLTITLLDSTIICIAPESARLLNNSIYCMSNQGAVAITESGISIMSRPIEYDLLQLTAPQFTGFAAACYAISYESERLYMLGMPTNVGDVWATQSYPYNWVTNAWTHWLPDMAAGIVNPFDNKLYCSRPSNPSYVYQERKTYTYDDFYDDATAVTITGVDATGKIVSLSGTPLASWVGYALDQVATLNTSIITAVDTVNKTVTVTDVLPWVSTAAQILVPIPFAIKWAPITGGFPHFFKSWTRCNFYFNSGNFTSISANFESDLTGPITDPVSVAIPAIAFGSLYNQNGYGQGPYGSSTNYPMVLQTLVPRNEAWAHWIKPKLSVSFPRVRVSCLGVSISYDIISDVSG